MAIKFQRTIGGIKIYDSKDDSIVSMVDSFPVKLTAHQKSNSIELQMNSFFKVFQADEVESIDGLIPPVKTSEAIADSLRDLIFYVTTSITPITDSTPTNSITITLIAGENIAAGQVIAIDSTGKGVLYDIHNETYAGTAAGISIQSALFGRMFTVCIVGSVNVPGIGWIAGNEYYIGNNAILTNLPPTSPSINRLIAIGIDVDTVLINSESDVILS